jgi:hypothetical protein
MSNRSRSIAKVAALAALLVLPLAAGGCLKRITYRNGVVVKIEYIPVNPLDPRGPRDRYARMQAKRDGGEFIQVLPMFIYPGPFFFALAGGVSDPELLDESVDGIGCFEVFEEGFFGDLDHSFALCGRYSAGGYQVFNSENDDFRFYPGVSLVDLRIDYDGADVTLSSRPQGALSYDVVTSFAFDFDTRLLPSVGGFNFGKKGVFDLLDVDWDTTAPTDTTVDQGCAWHLYEAYRHDFSAFRRLDGGAPDFASATTDLGLARDELSQALALTPGFIDAKIGKQVARYIVRADRKLEKAQEEVADQDANGATNQLLKSFRDQGAAYQSIFQFDFKDMF